MGADNPPLHRPAVQQRPAPHPTSLREATLSSFVERDSRRAVAHNRNHHGSPLLGGRSSPHIAVRFFFSGSSKLIGLATAAHFTF